MLAPLLLLMLALTKASGPAEGMEGALPHDDECLPGEEGGVSSCALQALQLRAAPQPKGRVGPTDEQQALTGQPRPESLAQLGGNQSAKWGMCGIYGCHGYQSWQACQCNEGCKKHGNCCFDYSYTCAKYHPAPAPSHGPSGHGSDVGVMSLYHQTSPEACQSILKGGFRIGRGGWCGKGIYFAVSPEDTKTKAITPKSGAGCMLEVKVNVGRVLRYPCCRYCGGKQNQHVNHNEAELAWQGYDSVQFNPGDGDEYIVYTPKKVLSIRSIPFKEAWRAHPVKHW